MLNQGDECLIMEEEGFELVISKINSSLHITTFPSSKIAVQLIATN